MRAIVLLAVLAGIGLGVTAAAPAAEPAAGARMRNSIGMELVLIPAGTFQMGSASGDDAGRPVREVRISKPFHIAVTEVTNAQWQAVMGAVPSHWKDDDHPVETASWDDALAFCRKLSELPDERAAGRVYRLPTEAEWEYACRAGTETAYSFGDDTARLGEHGWFADNSGGRALDADALFAEQEIGDVIRELVQNGCRTHPVGRKQPNAWGLHDMHGNVWEWCADWYAAYPAGAATDPTGPAGGSGRVIRGGGWDDPAGICRSADRGWFGPAARRDSQGLRLALSSSAAEPPEARRERSEARRQPGDRQW